MESVTNLVQIKTKHCNLNYISQLFVILLTIQWFTTLVGSSSSVSQAISVTAEQPDILKPTPEPTYDGDGGFQDGDNFYSELYDPAEIYKLDSDYCKGLSSCSNTSYQTFPGKLCHCDKLCGLLNDCCHNTGNTISSNITKDQFECVPLREIVKPREYGVTMITKCFHKWDHKETKSLCEQADNPDDILLRLPVTERTYLNLMYKNMYCAQCNYVEDFQFWKPELTCRNETGVRSLPDMDTCTWFFIRPHNDVTYRTCQYFPRINSSCSQSLANSDDLIRNCTEGTYSIVYDELGSMYQNEYCARCNGVQGPVFCGNLNPPTQPMPTMDPRTGPYSLKLLVDFNKGTVSQNDETEKEVTKCKDNEIYDSFSVRCREIFCAPPLMPISGKCKSLKTNLRKAAVEGSVFSMQNFSELDNCTLVRLNPSEFEFTNKSELFIFSQQKIYSKETFRKNGTDVFICSDEFQGCTTNCQSDDVMTKTIFLESYITLVGLLLSIFCLAITLIVYVAFPQLLNTPGKILVSLIIALLIAHLLFVLAAKSEAVPELCFTVGILIHYFFLAAFCWMNVIAFDLWMTFSNRFITSGSESKAKRFILYSLYGWLVPLVIVLVAIVLEFTIENSYFKPGYGNEKCWITSNEAIILFFAGPLALFKLFDIVSFIFTAIHIARAQRQGRMATHKNGRCSLIINIKLSLIMGLTWVFAFVANMTKDQATWYLFIIFNSLQGLFIAICFLCTKKVGRLLRDKYKHITTRITFGTQVTSVGAAV